MWLKLIDWKERKMKIKVRKWETTKYLKQSHTIIYIRGKYFRKITMRTCRKKICYYFPTCYSISVTDYYVQVKVSFLTDDIPWSFRSSMYLRVGQSTQLCFITKNTSFLQIAIMFRPKRLLSGESYTTCYKMQVNAHFFPWNDSLPYKIFFCCDLWSWIKIHVMRPELYIF